MAGTTRTLVAVGTVNEPSIDCTTLAATPRSGSTVEAPGVINVGIGFTTGSAGLTNGVDIFVLGSTFFAIGSVTGRFGINGFALCGSEIVLANCDFGIGGTPGFVGFELVEPFKDGVPLKSAKKSHHALSTELGSL
ncbi:unannotated protein [freshwater metagenome]|uniref:Unannotated protein n=1 Tax=freshwater metagenome TaxID=449393 RepID=A0A6J7DHT9_9ZZZZ